MEKLLAFLLAIFISLPGYASILGVSPTQLFLSAENPITVLTLTNPNDAPTLIQLKVMRWTQQKVKTIISQPRIFWQRLLFLNCLLTKAKLFVLLSRIK